MLTLILSPMVYAAIAYDEIDKDALYQPFKVK